jgi:hypothetical protein
MPGVGVTARLARLRSQIETCERLLLSVSDERMCQALRSMIAAQQAELERLAAEGEAPNTGGNR